MKKLIISLLLIVSVTSYSQKVYNMDSKISNFPLFEQTKDSAIYKGIKYGVYKDRKGALFIFYTMSNGRVVRRYIY